MRACYPKHKELWKLNSKKTTWLKNGPETVTDKIHRWQVHTRKYGPHCMPAGKCKVKQWATAAHLWEQPRSRTQTALSVVKDVEDQGFLDIAGEAVEWYVTLDTWVPSYKIRHALSIWSSSHALRCLPTGTETVCPHKSLHMNIYSTFLPNCPSLGTTKMSFCRRMR